MTDKTPTTIILPSGAVPKTVQRKRLVPLRKLYPLDYLAPGSEVPRSLVGYWMGFGCGLSDRNLAALALGVRTSFCLKDGRNYNLDRENQEWAEGLNCLPFYVQWERLFPRDAALKDGVLWFEEVEGAVTRAAFVEFLRHTLNWPDDKLLLPSLQRVDAIVCGRSLPSSEEETRWRDLQPWKYKYARGKAAAESGECLPYGFLPPWSPSPPPEKDGDAQSVGEDIKQLLTVFERLPPKARGPTLQLLQSIEKE